MRMLRVFSMAIFMVIGFSAITLLPSPLQTAPIESVDAQTSKGSTSGDENLVCKIFPFIKSIDLTAGLCGGNAEESVTTIATWLRFILSLVFIGIILVAVVSIIRAAIQYIRSEGDEGKVQDASKAIKAVFVGIGALIVGLVGLAIVLTVVGANDALDQPEAPEDSVVDDFLNTLTE